MMPLMQPSTYPILYFVLQTALHQKVWSLIRCWGPGLMVLVSRGHPYQSVSVTDSTNQFTLQLTTGLPENIKDQQKKLRFVENITRHACRLCSFVTTTGIFGSSCILAGLSELVVAPPTAASIWPGSTLPVPAGGEEGEGGLAVFGDGAGAADKEGSLDGEGGLAVLGDGAGAADKEGSPDGEGGLAVFGDGAGAADKEGSPDGDLDPM
jgi:hypothetical protein